MWGRRPTSDAGVILPLCVASHKSRQREWQCAFLVVCRVSKYSKPCPLSLSFSLYSVSRTPAMCSLSPEGCWLGFVGGRTRPSTLEPFLMGSVCAITLVCGFSMPSAGSAPHTVFFSLLFTPQIPTIPMSRDDRLETPQRRPALSTPPPLPVRRRRPSPPSGWVPRSPPLSLAIGPVERSLLAAFQRAAANAAAP
jgi:hypothetical protein